MVELYISGANWSISGAQGSFVRRIIERTPNRLFSLHESYRQAARHFMAEVHQVRETNNMSIMFDSGAFTSWSKGEDAPKLSELVRVYERALAHCASKFKSVWFITLDVIPGSPGRTPNKDEIGNAVRVSDENHKVLAAALGEHVLPVFHQGESLDRLQEIAEMNFYVCISPRNDIGERDRRSWAKRVHAEIKGSRTHGLAVTSGETMSEVPWTSVDSATWVQQGAYGSVLVLVGGRTRSVQVSEQSSARRNWGRHIDTMTREARALIAAQCEELAMTLSELRSNDRARYLFNIETLTKAANQPHREVLIPTTLVEL